jgi:hypothetical protein
MALVAVVPERHQNSLEEYCLDVPFLLHEIQYIGNITAVFFSRGTFCIVCDPSFWRNRVERMDRQKDFYYELYIPIYIGLPWPWGRLSP